MYYHSKPESQGTCIAGIMHYPYFVCESADQRIHRNLVSQTLLLYLLDYITSDTCLIYRTFNIIEGDLYFGNVAKHQG